MANSVTVSKLQVLLSGNFAVSQSTLLALSQDFQIPAVALSYAFGTAAGQVDRLYLEERAIAANTNDDIDLAGALTGPDGVTITLARVKFVILLLRPSPATPFLTVGNEGTNPWVGFFGAGTHTVQLRNGPKGGIFVNACGDATGWAVTGGTGDKLRVRNPDATLAASVVTAIGGCSV